MSVTSGKDPDEFIKEFGRDAFYDLVKKAVPSTEFKLNIAKKGIDITDDEGKIEYIRRATEILGSLSPVQADIYVKRLASELKVSESAIKNEISNEAVSKERQPDYRKPSEEERYVLNQILIKLLLLRMRQVLLRSHLPIC